MVSRAALRAAEIDASEPLGSGLAANTEPEAAATSLLTSPAGPLLPRVSRLGPVGGSCSLCCCCIEAAAAAAPRRSSARESSRLGLVGRELFEACRPELAEDRAGRAGMSLGPGRLAALSCESLAEGRTSEGFAEAAERGPVGIDEARLAAEDRSSFLRPCSDCRIDVEEGPSVLAVGAAGVSCGADGAPSAVVVLLCTVAAVELSADDDVAASADVCVSLGTTAFFGLPSHSGCLFLSVARRP